MATEEGEGQGIATVLAFEALAHREENLPLVLSLSLGSLAFDACHSLCTRLAATTAFSVSECHDYMQQQRQVCLYASETQQARINVAFQMLGLRKTILASDRSAPASRLADPASVAVIRRRDSPRRIRRRRAALVVRALLDARADRSCAQCRRLQCHVAALPSQLPLHPISGWRHVEGQRPLAARGLDPTRRL